MERYDPETIELKWQDVWARERAFSVPNPSEPEEMDEPHTYVLEMLPYPSGELHMGHVKNYTLGDVLAHVRRRMGFARAPPDGLRRLRPPGRERGHPRGRPPAPGHRAQHRRHPRADASHGLGDRLGPRGLARPSRRTTAGRSGSSSSSSSRASPTARRRPSTGARNDQTVLANEQVIDGRCERCGAEVERRNLEQWFFRITAYADRLLDEMSLLESWPEHVLTMQRNWIGRSEGAEVVFRIEELDVDIPVFTTRPDTLFGATFFVLAPEHPLVPELVAGTPHEAGGARLRAPRGRPLRDRARRPGEGEDRRLHRARS